MTQLVEKFSALALAQDKVEFNDEIGKYNRLYREMESVKAELKVRAGDQRKALLPLLNHPNAQVRYMASVATLAIDLQAARRALQIISDRNEYTQAADARGMMKCLTKDNISRGESGRVYWSAHQLFLRVARKCQSGTL